MGRPLNLAHPVLFSEKLQWLKLYNHREEYTSMVDKVEAKRYAASIIGEKYIIPTIAVYDSFAEIDWDSLPQQFVLKTTNGGNGDGVVICRDKSKLDYNEVKRSIHCSFKRDLYALFREWPYKNVKPRIIIEQYMKDDKSDVLSDYKFSCFGGVVHDVMVCVGRGSGDTKFYFFDRHWNLLRINKRGVDAPEGFTLPKPACMDEMFDIAAKLSAGLPYARVDLYAINNNPFFGEITFFPSSGYGRNFLPETERLFGDLIILPSKTEE